MELPTIHVPYNNYRNTAVAKNTSVFKYLHLNYILIRFLSEGATLCERIHFELQVIICIHLRWLAARTSLLLNALFTAKV